mmetsp:Transcript_4099/g.8910  ORF Transcript_4099/g.8910 Transcript_4099/m.8910 type:complete len:201 (+) Transcript_4099:773-1375(+)
MLLSLHLFLEYFLPPRRGLIRYPRARPTLESHPDGWRGYLGRLHGALLRLKPRSYPRRQPPPLLCCVSLPLPAQHTFDALRVRRRCFLDLELPSLRGRAQTLVQCTLPHLKALERLPLPRRFPLSQLAQLLSRLLVLGNALVPVCRPLLLKLPEPGAVLTLALRNLEEQPLLRRVQSPLPDMQPGGLPPVACKVEVPHCS